ncbi:hypothetical protein NQ315_004819 [Exocentrus adspersus]|uniref:Uncharacterized protein n=1 Tax=Exocentrus adspersus TaxID=1586481 RepID=A0AAV8W292_9CUCU|nr:hypothetical protein NQ315_004819 [Exocentrus adspersus]
MAHTILRTIHGDLERNDQIQLSLRLQLVPEDFQIIHGKIQHHSTDQYMMTTNSSLTPTKSILKIDSH